jgi:enoyl-CoA hydratase/carnithine racemase
MQFATLEVTVTGARGDLALNRPAKLNAMSSEMLLELADAAHFFDEQPAVKVVVVSGRGRAFSAGADVSAFAAADPGSSARRKAADVGRIMAESVESMKALTVARIHGHCVGGAVVLAAACDLRVAADATRFSIPEVDLGIPLAWGGIPRLVREIGPAMTKELVLTCRPFSAEEARELGFVNRVVAEARLDETVDALADALAAKSELTLRDTKLAVNAASDAMVPTAGAWSDADALVSALGDPESQQVAEAYLRRLGA